MSTVVVGGKGSALSAESIYNIACGISDIQLDPVTLEKLSKNSSSGQKIEKRTAISHGSGQKIEKCKITDTVYSFLDPIESRAVLVVLANKLLQAQAQIRPVIPKIIEKFLNSKRLIEIPASDKALVRVVVQQIYDGESLLLDGFAKEDFFVTVEEMEVMESCFPETVGISAVAIFSASVLSVAADAVAGISCEAVKINSQAFDFEPFGEGFINKVESEVACDMRTLLFGSRLVSPKNSRFEEDSAYFSIPFIHGCLREDLKMAQNKIRIEVNSTVMGRKPASGKLNSGEGLQLQSLTRAILALAVSLEKLGSSSYKRAEQNIRLFEISSNSDSGNVFSPEFRGEGFSRIFRDRDLKACVEVIFHMIVVENDFDGAFVAIKFFELLKEVRKILAWEASTALALLSLREKLVEQKSVAISASGNINGGSGVDEASDHKAQESKLKQRGEKKKKGGGNEVVLGKGIASVRQVIMNILRKRTREDGTPENWDEKLDSVFVPEDVELQILLDTMKTVLESNEIRRLPKIPKGTRDFKPEQMAIRERAFAIIAGVFKRHGAVALDTPVFELRETLMGKYGEDSKLIYDLADQGGEICSLRYDLTVPFARYLAMYNITNLKRYHIARVYRRDNPSKGRYREFYQCDFDIAGQYASMLPDFEVLKVLTELLDELDIGDYEVKLNHRKLLDGMLDICGVPQEKFRAICSAIDKLDKQPWDQVRKEMVEKGLMPETADRIGSLVLKKGRPLEMLAELKQKDSCFLKHDGSIGALQELETLFNYLEHTDCLSKIVFDLSLARGLDYYTGVIYEAVFKGSTQVGSIAAGGRYDNLVGMFSGKQVPAVGVSLGIERVFAIMEQQHQDSKKVIRATQTEVLAVVLGDDMGVAMKLVSELWAGKLKAEFALTSNKKIGKQIQNALESGIPYMLIMGENELNKGLVILKDIQANKQEEVSRDRIVEELKKRLSFSNTSATYTVVQ